MLFAWDPRKARANERKHGVSFADATQVFDDPDHLVSQDREVDGEQRWQVIGRVGDVRILFVACTILDDRAETTRIISARQALKREIARYVKSC